MKQTSQAVALLLALDSTQAAAVNVISSSMANIATSSQVTGNILYLSSSLNHWQFQTQFNTYGGNNNNMASYGTGDALSNRTAPYNRCANFAPQSTTAVPCAAPATNYLTSAGNGWKTVTPREALISTINTADGSSTNTSQVLAINAHKAAFGNSAAAGTPARFSNCVECLQANGVWCSRTFSYQTSGTSLQTNQSSTASCIYSNPWTAANGLTDNGACCGAISTLMPYIAKINATKTALESTGGSGNILKYNSFVCPAFSNTVTTVAGTTNSSGYKLAATIDAMAWAIAATSNGTVSGDTAKMSWWCSNGLYNIVPVASNNIYNIQQVIGDRENNRQELALVGCPQISNCGSGNNVHELTDNTATTGATAVKAIDVNNITPDQKCTYVLRTKQGPPAFKIENPATGASGVNADWIIHHMEYNSNQFAITSGNLIKPTDAIDENSFTPMFVMPNNLYSKQRTWYGVGQTAATNISNFNSPYNNQVGSVTGFKSQQSWGYVASFVGSTSGTDYDATASKTWDSRQVRFFPAQIAVNSNALGTAIVSQYGTAKTAYDTAKTNWDNYVAILTKNAKVDAFAAAFSPPKAPTVPPLPNKPWLPSSTTVATAMSRLAPAQVQFGVIATGANATGATQPTAANFWTSEQAALVAGGWGSFTAATIKYRNGWGKSFGTIGYSSASTTGWNGLGQVYNQQWQCSHTGTTGTAYATTPTATTACPLNYTAISTSATPTANSVYFYVALSVWAVQTTATGTANVFSSTTGATNSAFKLTFTIGTWSSALQLAAPGAMAAATAASSLTGVAGAHALAASAAAALATAATLY